VIYAISGRSNPGAKLLSGVEGYNPFPEKPGWTAMASMPKARERAAATQYNNVIYVAGGSDGKTGDSSPLKTLEAYDPLKNTWKTLASMHTARDGPAAVTGTDGRIYVMGGLGDSGYLSSVEAYDPVTKKWETMTSMNTARGGPAAVLGPDGQIYAIGGQDGADTLATTEIYNFTTKTWTLGPSMSVGRQYPAAVTGFDRGIYALGGYTPLSGVTDSVEVLFVA
jgi:influenza virus NS1A-binding protein